MRQVDLAGHIGVQQVWISKLEGGKGGRAPLETWVALGVALDRPLAVGFSRRLGALREPLDAGHLAMQERLLAMAREMGRQATVELPSRPTNPSHSIDVCVRDDRNRLLLIEEAWNSIGDLGAAIRSTNRKAAEAAALAAAIDDGPPYRVAIVWVLRSTAANRALVARYPQIFRSAFPGSSRAWADALRAGLPPPHGAGLVWLDPGQGRVTEARQRVARG